MRLFFTTLLCIAAALTVSAQDTFKSLSETKGTETVFISESMMQITGSRGNGGASMVSMLSGFPISNYSIGNIKNMEIYTCNRAEAIEKARKVFAEYKKAHPNHQVLIKVKEDNELTEIVAIPASTPTSFKTLIIFNAEPSEVSIIVINGKLSGKDISCMNFNL